MLNIEILGFGCPTCYRLAELCREVISEKDLDASVQSITDKEKIEAYGVLRTPTLVINGKIMVSGKLPTKPILKKWFQDAQAAQNIAH